MLVQNFSHFFKLFFIKRDRGKNYFLLKNVDFFCAKSNILPVCTQIMLYYLVIKGGGVVPAMTKYQLAIPLLRPNSIKKSWFWGVVGQLKVKFCMLSSC